MNRAEQQLLGGGYDKLSFTIIAEDLNTTRANIHYHFKNKETLAVEVLKRFGGRSSDEFYSLRETFKGNFFGFAEALDNSFWREDDSVASAKAVACSMLVNDPKLPLSLVELSKKFYQEIEVTLINIVQDAIDHREIRADIDAKREAMRVHVILMGIVTSALHMPSRKQAKQQIGGIILDWANSLK